MIRALPVTYITNLMAMFPRSPVTASRLLSVRPDRSLVGLGNYYGRTAGFRRPNDALPMWDRWLGADRTVIPTELGDEVGRDMRGLFGTLEAMGGGRPVLAKNNGLNAAAHLVGDVLPTAHFVCMDRDPVFLAQSLLQARRQIHGDDAIPYGLHGGQRHTDPVDDVVSQVCWHRELAMTQQAALGADRFWRVSYEAFCADPAPLVDRVAREVLDVSPSIGDLPTLQASRRVTLESDEFDRLERRVKEQVL